MDITLNEFVRATKNKVNALVTANDRREKPWTRRDFLMYIRGACDWFKFVSGDDFDTEMVADNIFIDSDILDEIKA